MLLIACKNLNLTAVLQINRYKLIDTFIFISFSVFLNIEKRIGLTGCSLPSNNGDGLEKIC